MHRRAGSELDARHDRLGRRAHGRAAGAALSFGFAAGLGEPRILFDCFFYSLLNFTFFGFGDVTPQSIPAKLVTLMEVTLAFFTVIFLLSDFISLKDSLRGGR